MFIKYKNLEEILGKNQYDNKSKFYDRRNPRINDLTHYFKVNYNYRLFPKNTRKGQLSFILNISGLINSILGKKTLDINETLKEKNKNDYYLNFIKSNNSLYIHKMKSQYLFLKHSILNKIKRILTEQIICDTALEEEIYSMYYENLENINNNNQAIKNAEILLNQYKNKAEGVFFLDMSQEEIAKNIRNSKNVLFHERQNMHRIFNNLSLSLSLSDLKVVSLNLKYKPSNNFFDFKKYIKEIMNEAEKNIKYIRLLIAYLQKHIIITEKIGSKMKEKLNYIGLVNRRDLNQIIRVFNNIDKIFNTLDELTDVYYKILQNLNIEKLAQQESFLVVITLDFLSDFSKIL